MNLFNNNFIQALGVAALVYLLLLFFGWGLKSVLLMLETFSRWYRIYGIKYAEEAAIACGLAFLLIASVVNSRNRN